MTAVVAALITGVVGGMLTGYFAPRWKAQSDRRAVAKDLEIRYSAALLRAAHELQSRLYNLLAKDFRRYLDGNQEERTYAEQSTLWLVGQYFCWLEIMRREAHYLLLASSREGVRLLRQVDEVASAFASDRHAEPSFRIFRAYQRALGELMIVSRHGADGSERLDCMGYAEFTRRLATDQGMRDWFDGLSGDVRDLASTPRPSPRLVRVQHGLVDLVNFIDSDRSRMPEQHARREKLPAPDAAETTASPAPSGSAF